MRASSRVALASALAGAVLAGATASAHRRDELLQAARIAIDPTRVELQLDLTPGIEVADDLIADIDRDGDGVLSADEKRGYVAHVLEAVALDEDGTLLRVTPTASIFPDVQSFTRGEGTIQLRAEATLPPLSNGAHRLSYRNSLRPDISVYLSNALVPDDDRVAVHRQGRVADQHDLAIEYDLRSPSSATTLGSLLVVSCIAGAFMLRTRRKTSGRS